ncbi:MAG: hypothetical protein KGS72_04635 [Cyanobacteria bacterium REEB67]|nr:hypothetical protein [Cyanobacteria bacterium REEB67]
MQNQGTTSVQYFGALGADIVTLGLCNPGTIWQNDVTAFPITFHCPLLNNSGQNMYPELFAEQFVVLATTNWQSQAGYQSTPPNMDYFIYGNSNVPVCSTRWVLYYMYYLQPIPSVATYTTLGLPQCGPGIPSHSLDYHNVGG